MVISNIDASVNTAAFCLLSRAEYIIYLIVNMAISINTGDWNDEQTSQIFLQSEKRPRFLEKSEKIRRLTASQ